MALIMLDQNPGPESFQQVGTEVHVRLKDGLGAVVAAPYDDLETLAETVRLFLEAYGALEQAIITARGRERTVESIGVSDDIVVDGHIVEVTSMRIHDDRISFSYAEGGAVEFDRAATVVQIPKQRLASV